MFGAPPRFVWSKVHLVKDSTTEQWSYTAQAATVACYCCLTWCIAAHSDALWELALIYVDEV